ncbi:MAG: Fic family protein [Acidobacteriota bacterium]
MEIFEKVRLIQKLSGYSQEKLAQELGVSFATLNSWINSRSIPRQKAKYKIDDMLSKYTGGKLIPENELEAKKQFLLNKIPKNKNLLEMILKSPDIYDQFILSLTFNTNKIEGSSLTEPETAAILFDNIALPDKNIIEHMEVKNHQAALQYLFKYLLVPGNKIDESLILKLHAILMNSILENAGNYRQHGVRIVGSHVPTANHLKIPIVMKDLIDDIENIKMDIISKASIIHSRFEQIHPFSDGNGRIGRLLLHAMFLQYNLPPAIIKQEDKRLYYTYLQKAQLSEDYSLLTDFICDALLFSFQKIKN